MTKFDLPDIDPKDSPESLWSLQLWYCYQRPRLFWVLEIHRRRYANRSSLMMVHEPATLPTATAYTLN